MTAFAAGVRTILVLELLQRVRRTAWYVLLGVFVALIAVLTVVLSVSLPGLISGSSGSGVYSVIIYFVLLLSTLVTPALSGNAINGDRDAGTLATTQVTLVTTGQLVLGKFLAAWIAALAFLAAALPFLIFSAVTGGVSAIEITISVLILIAELGVIAAIGVGLSGLIARPLFSIVLSYLAVAALSIGTLFTFAVAGIAVQTQATSTSYVFTDDGSADNPPECTVVNAGTYMAPRWDLFWPILVANPYVLLADAVPTSYNESGYPDDLFGSLKYTVRSLQIPPDLDAVYDDCDLSTYDTPKAQEVIDLTTPGWFVGLLIHLVLAAGALFGAWARTRTPAARLGKDTRVA